MKNNLKWVALLVILLIILGFYWYYASNHNIEFKSGGIVREKERDESLNTDQPRVENPDVNIYENSSGSGGGGGAGGESGDDSGNEESSNFEENATLPGDVYEVECGYYFEIYGVCAGKCSKGVCVSEGRSCYCRTI